MYTTLSCSRKVNKQKKCTRRGYLIPNRHHVKGIEEIRKMWGDEAANAAKIYILVDCWGIPSKANYENGWVTVNGFTGASSEAEAKMMLREIVKK